MPRKESLAGQIGAMGLFPGSSSGPAFQPSRNTRISTGDLPLAERIGSQAGTTSILEFEVCPLVSDQERLAEFRQALFFFRKTPFRRSRTEYRHFQAGIPTQSLKDSFWISEDFLQVPTES